MENIPLLSIPFGVLAHVAFYLFIIVYVIFTIIFYYHWQSYSMDKKATLQTYLAYFVVTIPLLAIMGLSLLII